MAKLQLEVDTENDVCKVILNGVTLSDVYSLSLYRNGYEKDESYYIRVSTYKKNDDDTVTMVEHMMDCENESGMAQASEIPGFKCKPSLTQAQLDIQKLLRPMLSRDKKC